MGFIRQLQIFVTVAEMGNFTRAADTLHMARPGITKAIAIKTESMSLDYAKTNAFELLKNAVVHHLKTQL